ncbi:hypothetical protein [Cupriavidus pauculus]|uniref:hypothetical protein n=1 Tax=Cupriavidus pauculus TaxID=82633 RepID=UPI0012475619|nr:hypothetical protein [Cupriavidus pauculus]KAB0601566.1 hypothetical protein F7R19_16995 [Cupriavidus pauculus]UAL01385.1 hypothetical protein K8O84_08745 [Cupriavidus pauculus]
MAYKFSPSTLAFYPKGLLSSYASLPDDLVDATDEEWQEFGVGPAPAGMMRGVANGRLAWVAPPTPDLATATTMAITAIDKAADDARLAVAGDPLRAAEYQIAEAEAKAYQAAGYAGECPPSVKSWAEAKAWTSRQAADNIIAEAAAWTAALYAIRDVRLKAKENARNAQTSEAVAEIAHAAVSQITAMVANLGNATS